MKGVSLGDRFNWFWADPDYHLKSVDYRNQSAIQFNPLDMRQRADMPRNELERRNFALYKIARDYEGSSSWFKFNRGWSINFHDSSLMTNWTLDDPVNKGLVDDISRALKRGSRYMGDQWDAGKKAYQVGSQRGDWEETMRLQAAAGFLGKPYVRPVHTRVFSRATSG